MGCDIHFHIEVKINGHWEHYACPRIVRDYDTFAYMANVRNYNHIEYLSKPKGLSSDLSVITKLHYVQMHEDAHSASWLDLNEIKKLDIFLKKLAAEDPHTQNKAYFLEYNFTHCCLFRNWFSEFGLSGEETEEDLDFPQELEDVRFVFWFDN